jgi:hypothetical protein
VSVNRRHRHAWILALVGIGLLLSGGAFSAIRWKLLADEDTGVPNCAALVADLPNSATGAWGIRDPEPRRVTDSTTTCELAFTTADERFSGSVSVFILGSSDPDRLRREVSSGFCYGSARPVDDAEKYLAVRHCVELVGEVALAGVFAARDHRFVHMVATVRGGSADRVELTRIASEIARTVADRGLSLPRNGQP